MKSLKEEIEDILQSGNYTQELVEALVEFVKTKEAIAVNKFREFSRELKETTSFQKASEYVRLHEEAIARQAEQYRKQVLERLCESVKQSSNDTSK